MLMAFFLYYSLAMIIHPWYICIMVFLSLFTKYTFAIIWSFLVLFSYATYQTELYEENFILIAVEYILLFGYSGMELLRHAQNRMPLLILR
tara:strand:- start:205 stop:477 length:273 start_codon:yes stop_codon:yes gene_type:complete